MNNQILTTLLLVFLIALFSLRHYTLEINQTGQSTEISFGNITLSYGGPEYVTPLSLDKENGCIMEIGSQQMALAPEKATVLKNPETFLFKDIDDVIQTLTPAKSLQNSAHAIELNLLLHELIDIHSDQNNQQ